MIEKTAVILAGGKGTRLRPYTIAIPKPLVPVGSKPILEVIVIRLAKQGVNRIIIAVNHQADIIMAYFGDGSKWSVKIEYSIESQLLGTMGPLKLLHNLPDNFLVMNGDVLTDLDFNEFLDKHICSKAIFTIAAHRRIQKVDYGVLETANGRLTGFCEKPESAYTVSMGVYAVSKDLLDYIPNNTFYGFDSLMIELLRHNKYIAVYDHEGYWMDIGRPDDYEQAFDDIEKGIFTY